MMMLLKARNNNLILVNMPLSVAERQRRYREKVKRDPKHCEDYKRKKGKNDLKKKTLIKDLTNTTRAVQFKNNLQT